MKHFRLSEEQLAAFNAKRPIKVHHCEDHAPKAHRHSKYNNVRFTDSEGSWDSKKERKRWELLRLRESAGQIQNLRRQVPYELIPVSFKKHKRLRPITYVADFVYEEEGQTIVEDSKGVRNKVYLLKKRLMWEKYGIDILET